eukprot:g6447.t1
MSSMGDGCRSVAASDIATKNQCEDNCLMPSPVTNKVQVAVRIRPMNSKEESDSSDSCCISVSADGKQVRMGMDQLFTFDQVFAATAGQEDIFNEAAKPMLTDLFNGYNVTLMAYGQTGSGKTYTMGSDKDQNESCLGIIPRLLSLIFSRADLLAETHEITFKGSLLEIYQDKIRDLLVPVGQQGQTRGNKGLDPRVDGKGTVRIDGLTEAPLRTSQEAIQTLVQGLENRQVGATDMNAVSSRSHAVFSIDLDLCPREGVDLNGLDDSLKSAFSCKLTFVDLAGSERLKRTKATGSRMAEGIAINQGLSCLGAVINALAVNRAHVPYRDHKLTLLLKDALGGNSRTLFLACLSPAQSNFSETLSSLRYANKVKSIKNKAVVNRSAAEEKMHRMRLHIDCLTRAYVKEKYGGGFGCTEDDITELLSQERVKLDLSNIQERSLTVVGKTSSSSLALVDKGRSSLVSFPAGQFFDAAKPRKRSDSCASGSSTVSSSTAQASAEDKKQTEEEIAFLDAELKNVRKLQSEDDELSEANDEIEMSEQCIASKERILIKIKEDLLEYQVLQKEHSDLAQEMARAAKEQAELQAQLEQAEKEMAQQAEAGGKNRRQKLKAKLEEKQRRINALNQSLRQKSQKLSLLKRTTGSRTRVEEELRELKAKNVEMKRARTQREKEIRIARKERETASAKQLKALSATRRRLQKESDRSKKKDLQLERKQKQIAKLSEKLKKAKEQTMQLAKRKLSQHKKRKSREATRSEKYESAIDKAFDVVMARRIQKRAEDALNVLYKKREDLLKTQMANVNRTGNNTDGNYVELDSIDNQIAHQTGILNDSTAHANGMLEILEKKGKGCMKHVLDKLTGDCAVCAEEKVALDERIRKSRMRYKKLEEEKNKCEKDWIFSAGQVRYLKTQLEKQKHSDQVERKKHSDNRAGKKRSLSSDMNGSPFKKSRVDGKENAVRLAMAEKRKKKKRNSNDVFFFFFSGKLAKTPKMLRTISESGTPMAMCTEEEDEGDDEFDENGFNNSTSDGSKLFGDSNDGFGLADVPKRRSKRINRRMSLCPSSLRNGRSNFEIDQARARVAHKIQRKEMEKRKKEMKDNEDHRRMSIMGTLRGAKSRAERKEEGNNNLRQFGRRA